MTNPYIHEDIPWTSEAREIADWIVAQGLRGSNELELLDWFCERLNRCGAALIKAQIARHTLHPIFGAYASQWRAGKGVSQESFARGSDLNENWKRSPFAHMIENHLPEYRMALEQTNEPLPFTILDKLRGDGATEYVAFILPWGKADGFETEEGYASSWATNAPGGFSDEHMDLLRKLIGPFGLAIKTAGMLKIGGSLVETYLGRDAGWRVLRGEIQRGSMEVIDAVLWNCDIRGFTAAADWMPWNELITMLNDYLECIARPVEDGGGQILKFMGDGFIATFDLGDLDEAKVCRAAINGVKNVQSASRRPERVTCIYRSAGLRGRHCIASRGIDVWQHWIPRPSRLHGHWSWQSMKSVAWKRYAVSWACRSWSPANCTILLNRQACRLG